ncbi:hypothetical protein EJB05_19298 [Eragrostis curvula]|uniref:Nudix hydrolase domain-containing protein n=1 Tax=Eragrostis curvula TaxID=38414 RepID=A0A5J9UXH3_9POAL|nr:hypothetical protein EJB05_19298 [Eragrostis curvula]
MAMAGGGGLNRSTSRGQLPPQELLDDLCSRFLLNVPKEELESFERILFLLEQAHWFYEDNSVEHNPNLKSLSFRDFTSLMFKSCTALRPYIAHLDDIYKDFNNYKFRVPVSGAIILDDTYERCLLVKGWKAGASWSFPRGKRNKDEEDHTCAVREVLEETGCDVSTLLNRNDFIEVSIGQQRVRLYIITGVKRDTMFAPQTKKEISEISWHKIDELLPASEDAVSRGVNGLKLYMVAPFLTSVFPNPHFVVVFRWMGLKAWISTHPPLLHQKSEASARGTVWKAKSGVPSGGVVPSSVGVPVVENPATRASGGVGVPVVDNLATRAGSDVQHIDNRPGRSFRNFRFDTASIMQSMEASFLST